MSLFRKLVFCSKPPSGRQRSETECAVCQDAPTDPCTVPCGNNHIFCLACLQGLVAHNHYRNYFPCPLCRKRVRIPLGGVALLRNNRGFGSKFLSKIPAIRPKCRRSRSSASSSASSWPSDYLDISLPMFEPASLRSSATSDSGDLPFDVSSSTLSVTGPLVRNPALDGIFLLESIDVASQEAILEEIRREREQRERGSGVQRFADLWFEEESERELEELVTVREEAITSEISISEGGEDDILVCDETGGADIPTPAEIEAQLELAELDMSVVLQLISEMEENDKGEASPATAERLLVQLPSAPSQPPPPASPPPTRWHPCTRASSTRGSRRKEKIRCDERRLSDPRGIEDWKQMNIDGPRIPRPKLMTPGGPEEPTSQSSLPEEATVSGKGQEHFQPQASDSSAVHGNHLKPAEQWRKELSRLEMAGVRPAETINSEDPESVLSEIVQTDWRKRERRQSDMAGTEEAIFPSLEHQSSRNTSTSIEDSDEWEMAGINPVLIEAHRRASTRDQRLLSSNADEGAAEGLSPEEWRLQELQRLEMKRARTERFLEQDLYDAELTEEDPEEWIRQIRELQRRELAKASRKVMARRMSDGQKHKQVMRSNSYVKALDARKETAARVDPLRTEDISKNKTDAKNVTVTNV